MAFTGRTRSRLQGSLGRRRLRLAVPTCPGNPFGVEPPLAENNLVSTLVQFTPLVLTGFAVAFAFRCGLFNIGGTGAVLGRIRLCAARRAARRGIGGMVAATVAAAVGGAIWAGIAGGLKAYRGAHEVITTIMLNWIAIYTTQYLFGLAGRSRIRRQRRLDRTSCPTLRLPGSVGRRPASPHRHLHRARRPPSSTTCPQPHHARIRGARRRLQSRGGALRRHLRQALDHRLDGDLRGVRRASPGPTRCSASRTRSRPRTCPCSTSASPASRSRCSVATPPSAWCSRRSCSPRCRAAGACSRRVQP